MSHYKMGIITDSKPTEYELRRLMAPYDENLLNKETVFSREEMAGKIAYSEEEKEELLKDDDLYLKKVAENYGFMLQDGEDISEYENEVFTIGRDLSVYEWGPENPKWDYWHTTDYLEDKNGKRCKHLKIKNLSKESNEELYKKAIEIWEEVVERKEPQHPEKEKHPLFRLFNNKRYFENNYDSKEEYAKAFSTFSLSGLLYEGEWIESGQMGWFGVSFSDKESRKKYLEIYNKIINDPENQEKWITSVDCHI